MGILDKKGKLSGPGSPDQVQIASGGWEDVEDEVSRRSVMMCIYGETGTGRTRLALTAPGPIALAHSAEKVDGLMQKAKEFNPHLRTLKQFNFGCAASGTPQEIANQVGPVWNKATMLWNDAIDKWARTAIMDTDTEGWEYQRLRDFGELNPKGRIDSLYGPTNQRFRSLWKRARKTYACNVIFISQGKDEYKDTVENGQKTSKKTGRTIRAGMKEVPFAADIIVRTDFDMTTQQFKATIEKPWYNNDARGMELYDEDIRFGAILELITGIEEAEWMNPR